MKTALATGRLAEDYVSKLLRNAGLPAVPNRQGTRARLAEWDIESELGGRRFTLEVKYDVMASRTGNVAVEYYNTRSCRPSGITATTADLWVHVFAPLSAFVCRTGDLLSFVRSFPPPRSIHSGGDDNAALHLYPRAEILPRVFRAMDDLTPPELRALLAELLGPPPADPQYALAA